MLDVLKYGDPRLRKACMQVQDFSVLPDVISKMYDVMYEAEGIGLAANQIGENYNLFIIDISQTNENEKPAEFVNSKIIQTSGESTYSEGCLSVPGIEFDIVRPEFITLQYQKIDGSQHEDEFGGLFARAIQHEMDHLNGKLIIDHVNSIAKIRYKTQLKSIKEEAEFQFSQSISGHKSTFL